MNLCFWINGFNCLQKSSQSIHTGIILSVMRLTVLSEMSISYSSLIWDSISPVVIPLVHSHHDGRGELTHPCLHGWCAWSSWSVRCGSCLCHLYYSIFNNLFALSSGVDASSFNISTTIVNSSSSKQLYSLLTPCSITSSIHSKAPITPSSFV